MSVLYLSSIWSIIGLFTFWAPFLLVGLPQINQTNRLQTVSPTALEVYGNDGTSAVFYCNPMIRNDISDWSREHGGFSGYQVRFSEKPEIGLNVTETTWLGDIICDKQSCNWYYDPETSKFLISGCEQNLNRYHIRNLELYDTTSTDLIFILGSMCGILFIVHIVCLSALMYTLALRLGGVFVGSRDVKVLAPK